MRQEECAIAFRIPLLDGRIADICTESGANAFLQTGSESKEYIKGKLQRTASICSKKKLNSRDRHDLSEMNVLFTLISENASKEVFREHLEESSVRAWLNYATEQIKRYTTNRKWITTGKLPTHDGRLLCSFISMFSHAVPTAFAFEGDFFTVLAEFVEARKGTGRALPADDICLMISCLVSNAYITTRSGFDNTWTVEKALKKLDATGVLEQFLRCATVPKTQDSHGMFHVLDEFQACMPFISKKLQPGQPCGDVVIAILEGKDGSRVEHPSVLNRFSTMMRLANSTDAEQKNDDGRGLCGNCGKVDQSKSLMRCARCVNEYYCSRDCQKAHWSTHKMICRTATKQGTAVHATVDQLTTTFFAKNYVHIMVKMVETCEETGFSKNEMVVELDFKANKNGLVPALQDEPEFKITPTKDYLEGSRPAVPDWLKEDYPTTHKQTVKNCIQIIKDAHSKLLPCQILTLVRFEGGYCAMSYGTQEQTSNNEVYSEQAVLAFKAKIENDDDGPLSEIFGPEDLEMIQHHLQIHYRSDDGMDVWRHLICAGADDNDLCIPVYGNNIEDALNVLRMVGDAKRSLKK